MYLLPNIYVLYFMFTQINDIVCFLPLSSTATWPLDPPREEKQGWRHVRIKQTGKNASGQTHYLSLSGFELYGTVTGVCEDQLGMLQNNSSS